MPCEVVNRIHTAAERSQTECYRLETIATTTIGRRMNAMTLLKMMIKMTNTATMMTMSLKPPPDDARLDNYIRHGKGINAGVGGDEPAYHLS